MKRISFIRTPVLVLLCCIGCASPFHFARTSATDQYIAAAMSTPIPTPIAKADERIAWERVQSFLPRITSLPLNISTDVTIETDRPTTSDGFRCTYRVVKIPGTDTVRLDVTASFRALTTAKDATQDEELRRHVIAYHALTGNEPPADLMAHLRRF